MFLGFCKGLILRMHVFWNAHVLLLLCINQYLFHFQKDTCIFQDLI